MSSRAGLLLELTLTFCLVLPAAACSAARVPPPTTTAAPTSDFADWITMELTDVVTGETFRVTDFSGKVVLLETMAIWCPNCLVQASDIRKAHETLGNPKDLISISLDVDLHEDEAALKAYVLEYGLIGHFAVAPVPMARALGNLYTAQYLNPPLAPMMIIDRAGHVHHLEFGRKTSDVLIEHLTPFLSQ